MKKIEEYFAVNHQEDEDGCTPYSPDENNYENIKREEQIAAPVNTSKKQHASAKRSSRSLYMTFYRTSK